jgi:hypothetical protein
VAATKSANPTARNDTPNTPQVRESAIAKMKVDELRRKLRAHGVEKTAELKKPELVKKLIKAETAATTGKRSGAKKSTKTSTKTSAKASAKNPTARNDTPNTPDVSESAIAAMKADDLRRRLRAHGVKGTADLKKAELVKRLTEIETTAAKKGGRGGKKGTQGAKKKGGTLRTGKATSSSLKYSQEITSTDDKPERAGRSLVTTDHEVIRQWAKARKAVPATIAGSEHDGHLGVLRFDFPGYSGDRLTPVEWEEWLATFDKRRLNFIYQQRQSNGKRSNFFRLENPDE